MALGPLLASEPTANECIIQTDLTGLVNGLQLVVPRMRERNRGHVVNVASYAARYGVPGEGVYAATKHAIWALSEILRRELRSTHIEVTIALMDPVAGTGLAAGIKPQRGVPMVSPREVAAAISGTLRQPRFELWIPRRQGWLHALAHLLPRPARELAENAAGMGRVATDSAGACAAGMRRWPSATTRRNVPQNRCDRSPLRGRPCAAGPPAIRRAAASALWRRAPAADVDP